MMNELVRRPERRALHGVFGDDFDRLFDGFFRPLQGFTDGAASFSPAVDLVEKDDRYVVTAELPGVNRDDINVTVEDGVLTINAERRTEAEEKEDGRVIRQERRYGKFVRSMRLGNHVDEGKVNAKYKDGVLELVLPKSEAVQPKRIAVSG